MADARRKLICDDANLQNQDFAEAVLEGVCCMYARFDGSSFFGADLYWAMARGASFRNCDLRFAVFRGADLKDAVFDGAQLIGTNFSCDNLGGSTQLQGADLSGATIQECHFRGAEYDSLTRFPPGFDPDKNGLVCRERP
jgi:uncharacterized protein YjbI with pentapeptide repeats